MTAAQAAVDAFTTPYEAGWRDALHDFIQRWVEHAAAGVTWRTVDVTAALRRIAGVGGTEASRE